MSRGRSRRRGGSRVRRLGDLLVALCVLAALALAVDRFQRLNTRHLTGRVTVNDGDTLTLAGERIRLRGLDAPEYAQMCSRQGVAYACGRAARDMLRRLVAGGSVACQGHERDRYDRLLAVCTVDGEDIGAALVAAGWAVAYGDYDRIEAQARRTRQGLWDGEFDAPRDWRALHGEMAAEEESDLLGRLWGFVKRLLGRTG